MMIGFLRNKNTMKICCIGAMLLVCVSGMRGQGYDMKEDDLDKRPAFRMANGTYIDNKWNRQYMIKEAEKILNVGQDVFSHTSSCVAGTKAWGEIQGPLRQLLENSELEKQEHSDPGYLNTLVDLTKKAESLLKTAIKQRNEEREIVWGSETLLSFRKTLQKVVRIFQQDSKKGYPDGRFFYNTSVAVKKYLYQFSGCNWEAILGKYCEREELLRAGLEYENYHIFKKGIRELSKGLDARGFTY